MIICIGTIYTNKKGQKRFVEEKEKCFTNNCWYITYSVPGNAFSRKRIKEQSFINWSKK